LVSAGRDGRAIIWDAEMGAEFLRIEHNQWILARWARGGDYLTTSSDDQYVRFWDGKTGALRLLVRTSRELVGLDHSPAGDAIAMNLGRGFTIFPVDLSELTVDSERVLAEARERGFSEAPMVERQGLREGFDR
jgi:WD40 repeat protein